MSPEEIKKIIKEKVDGVWCAEHDETGHKYRHVPTGKIQKSVTTKIGGVISKPHLTKWSIRMAAEWLLKEDRLNRFATERFREDMINGMCLAPTDIRDESGNLGTVAHSVAERYTNEFLSSGIWPANIMSLAPSNCDPRAIAAIRSVEAFFKKHDVIPLASEILVGDERYSAGTLDLIALFNGELTLVDYKSSNGIDQIGYSTQVAAYKYFFEGMTGLKIKHCKILHISKDYDKFTVYKVKGLPGALKAFKQICSIYDWVYNTGDKISKDIKRITI